MSHPTRRTVATHTAWAIPAMTVAAATPSVAASVTPSISRTFSVTRTTGCASASGTLTVVSNNDGESFFQIVHATASTNVTNVMASVLLSVSGLKFTTSTGNWGPVTQDPQRYTNNGITYYRYFSTLSVAPSPATGGIITIPKLSWTSTCSTALASTVWANGRGTATINGTQQTQVGIYRQV